MNAKFLTLVFLCLIKSNCALQLQVLTVATEETDGFRRFINSGNHFNIPIEVVGMGMEWKGGDIMHYPGGGFKVNLIRPVLEQWKDKDDLIVMFVDSYDVIFAADVETILHKFEDFEARVVFSAEQYCWPDKSLASVYPKVGLGKRFLCSGGFIGYASDVYSIVSDSAINDIDDDQLYYTNIYLNESKRFRHSMKLDHRSHIFQNLNGVEDEIELVTNSSGSYAYNNLYNTRPAVLHGNGASKIFLNFLGNYLPNQYNEETGCAHCYDNNIELSNDTSKWPTVFIGFFIGAPTPFFNVVLERIINIAYPKDHIRLHVYNKVDYHEEQLRNWMNYTKTNYNYEAMEYVNLKGDASDDEQNAMKEAIRSKSDYYLMINSMAMIEPNTLKELIKLNKSVIAPLMRRINKLWSNFWGDISSDGFYARSRDYFQLVQGERKGIWNEPYINTVILFKGDWLRELSELPVYTSYEYDRDMTFCKWMRDNGHFMYMTNLQHYGHLLNAENYETNHLHNDLYNIFENRFEWEQKYLHENYSTFLSLGPESIPQPCNDVYWFPLLSSTYAKEIVEELENFGQWSNGENDDPRLQGGYENVPTRDIHMKQIGFEKQWLDILSQYVVPIQTKVFPGYYSRAMADLNFVVKYHPQGQPDLRPHHDSSTFTINVALTRPGIDHEGGGCKFIRQNCSVVDTKLGWALMHPGRLTHYHEGLPTTKGTRYIMVSFVDP